MSDEDTTDGEEDWFEAALSEADEADESEPASASTDDAESDRGADSQPGETMQRSTREHGDDSVFEDDFAAAFEATSAGESGFDSSFESNIPRLELGIGGLDDMIQGGVPKRHLMVCIGGAGSGKTTFGLQFLHHGLENDQKGVIIALEQSHQAIIDTANEHGWEFDRFEQQDKLAIVDLDPVEMANSLENIRGELPGLIEQFGADRLVLDSVSLLEMMYGDQARRRTEVFDFTRSLKQAGVTTFLTSEADQDNPYASRHGIIEYLTDAVFVLQFVRGETQETRLAVEIQKLRNTNHSRQLKPFEITKEGISVYQQANIF